MNRRPPIASTSDSDQPNVPTFGCVVYVAKIDGGVRARIANLADFEATGSDERDALGKIIKAFKELATQRLASGEKLDWLEPPLDMDDDEQKRFVPVHL